MSGSASSLPSGGEHLRAQKCCVLKPCEHLCFAGWKFTTVLFPQRDQITDQHHHSTTVDITADTENSRISPSPNSNGDFHARIKAHRLTVDQGTSRARLRITLGKARDAFGIAFAPFSQQPGDETIHAAEVVIERPARLSCACCQLLDGQPHMPLFGKYRVGGFNPQIRTAAPETGRRFHANSAQIPLAVSPANRIHCGKSRWRCRFRSTSARPHRQNVPETLVAKTARARPSNASAA